MENQIIKKNQRNFKEIQFVAAASFKDDKKSTMPTNSIFYDARKNRLWTTDGHRLHIANIGMGSKDLFFRVVSCRKDKIELELQAMDRPGLPKISAILNNVKTIYRHKMDLFFDYTEYAKLIRLFKTVAFNFNFILDLKLFSNKWTVLIQENEQGQQFFKSEHCLAVIMPLNVE